MNEDSIYRRRNLTPKQLEARTIAEAKAVEATAANRDRQTQETRELFAAFATQRALENTDRQAIPVTPAQDSATIRQP